MRGRYVRQTQQPDGTIVLLYSGDFRLEMGRRSCTADNAVIWLTPRVTGPADEPAGRRYFEITVYLSGSAEVHELGGTVLIDDVLLVRGLRTAGRIIKYQDAHATESVTDTPLYNQAVRDREAIERGEPLSGTPAPAVTRPQTPAEKNATPRLVRYHLGGTEPAYTADGEQVLVATGGVYFSQAGGPQDATLEIQAERAVVFPARRRGTSARRAVPMEETPAVAPREPLPTPPEEGAAAQKPAQPAPRKPSASDDVMANPLGGQDIRAVYLEGDVVLSLGARFVRASRLFYDFELERALILDAVFRADVPGRDVPLYVRADEIRQLSTREFAAQNAEVSTSEFYTPSYHVGAERVYLRDMTERDTVGRPVESVVGEYEMQNATLNVGGFPLLWWPYSKGRLETSETLLRGIRTGYSGDYGAEFESKWYLFNLMGMSPPPGYDASLRLDYFSSRGPAIGLDVDYERESHYGYFRGYFIHDEGEDSLGPLRRREEKPDTPERGRILWRHRQFLSEGWEATVEFSYLSDPYFLEEYEKDEYQEGKDQETVLYLKRAADVSAFEFLANWRLQEYLTQTEHLPEITYRRIGDTFLDPVLLYHESRVGAVRYRVDERQFFEESNFRNDGSSDDTFRGDVRQEAELPLKLGPVRLVPFATVRGTYWDGQPLDDGALWRGLGVYGLRGSTSLSRVFTGLESELLDIHDLRHIVSPQFAAWWAHSNTRSERITPFDYGVETVDAFYGFFGGIRQVWQTRRGPADARRTVDLVSLNLETGVFGNTDGREDDSDGWVNPLRPETSRTRNYVAGDLAYRLSDTTTFMYDFNIDMTDGAYDRHNVAIAVERSPRLAYVFGTRYAGDIDMNFIGGGWNYEISPKHITAVRSWFDIDSGQVGEVTVSYIRRLPRWYVGLNFQYDNIDDDFTISLSIWPEGIPEWTLGSRRFTGLSQSMGIRP